MSAAAVTESLWGICLSYQGPMMSWGIRGQLLCSGLEKDPSCLVLTSFSCSSCLCPRLYRYSMCITSVFLIWAFCLNSSRIRGMKPGLSTPARRNWRYRARTCFCSLLCLTIAQTQPQQTLLKWKRQDHNTRSKEESFSCRFSDFSFFSALTMGKTDPCSSDQWVLEEVWRAGLRFPLRFSCTELMLAGQRKDPS